jgi:hypothetical protein
MKVVLAKRNLVAPPSTRRIGWGHLSHSCNPREPRTRVRAFDPVGMEQAKQVLADVTYCRDPYDCVEEADAVVIVTEWEQFRALDLERVRDLMACPVMVDLRNVYLPDDVKKHGFAYISVGRLPTQQPVNLAGTPFSIGASV